MSTKTRTRRTPKKPRPRTLHVTTKPVDLRHPLPIRTAPDTEFITTPAIRAAYAARLASLPLLPIRAWHAAPDGTATAELDDHTLLVHAGGHHTPFTAWTPCVNGAHHARPVDGPASLHTARTDAADCTHTHGTPVPAPASAPAVRTLGDALAHPAASNADTQALDLTELRTDHDEPKEHPET